MREDVDYRDSIASKKNLNQNLIIFTNYFYVYTHRYVYLYPYVQTYMYFGLLEVNLPWDPVCPSVSWSVSLHFPKEREVSPPCSYRSTCFYYVYYVLYHSGYKLKAIRINPFSFLLNAADKNASLKQENEVVEVDLIQEFHFDQVKNVAGG